MLPRLRHSALAAALLTLPALAHTQTLVGRSDSIYTRRGAMPPSALLTICNFNGPIDVRTADGSTTEVRAETRRSRGGGAIEDVAFEVQQGGSGDVTICGTFFNRNPCDDSRYRSDDDDRGNRRRNVTVAMTVLLPRGAHLKIVTGNGAVTVECVAGNVQASTGNGRVAAPCASRFRRAITARRDDGQRRASVRLRPEDSGPAESAPCPRHDR